MTLAGEEQSLRRDRSSSVNLLCSGSRVTNRERANCYVQLPQEMLDR